MVCLYKEILASNNTCLNAVDGNFAFNYKFNAPYNGTISGIRLVHNSGGMTCDGTKDSTNWGCHTVEGDLMMINLLKIGSHETSATNGVTLYPTNTDTDYVDEIWSYSCGVTVYEYSMSSYSVNSDELVLYSVITNYDVSRNDSFILGWNEPVCNVSTSDNSGTTCATVYFLYSDIDDYVPSTGMCVLVFCFLCVCF